MKTGSQVESLLEKLIELQASSSTFRLAFRTKYLDQFIAFAKSYLPRAASVDSGSDHSVTIRSSDKLSHLAMMLSLDSAISASQIREVSLVNLIYFLSQVLIVVS